MTDTQPLNFSSDYCTLDDAVQLIAGRHKLALIYAISQGHHHFGELGRIVYAVGRRTLAQQLGELVRAKLVIKTQTLGFPPQTHYSLSIKGEGLLPIINQLCAWKAKEELS